MMLMELTFMLFMLFSHNDLQLVTSQVTQSFSENYADEELHQNQIPPPDLQPSEDEVKKAILTLIEKSVDKNSDNKISTEELKDWLEDVHNKIIADNVDRQWQYFEPSVQEVHSWEGYAPEVKEVLNWENFRKATYPDEYLKPDPENPHYEATQKLMQRSEKRWNAADLNTDTVLTKEEFKGFIHPEESEKHHSILVDEALEDMDRDNDTLVTIDEYFAHLESVTDEAERSDPNWRQTHDSHFKDYLDRNKDGKLDRDELKEWIIPSYDKHEAEAYRLITLADDDKDGELSKDEISNYFQHFYSVLPPEFWNQFAPASGKHDEL